MIKRKSRASLFMVFVMLFSIVGVSITSNAAEKKSYSLTYAVGRPSSLNTLEKNLTLKASGASRVTINTTYFYRSSEEAYVSAYVNNYSHTGSARIQNSDTDYVYYRGTAPISGKSVSFTIKLKNYGQVASISASGTASS